VSEHLVAVSNLPHARAIREDIELVLEQVKQNSIQGCKLNNVSIVYTPWANLRKTASMEVGQVGILLFRRGVLACGHS
jgi:NFACT protein RNA binding domain